jgi:HAMP domain-containing protein/uncharacterized membrane protein
MRGRLSKGRVWWCVAGVVVYACLNTLSGLKYLPGCSFAELRPQVCLPMFLGLYFGPAAGFIVGAGGDSLGYVLAGTNPLPLWNWALANGLMGLIPGLAGNLRVRGVATLRAMQGVYLLILLAASLPFAFAASMEVLCDHMPPGAAFYSLFLPIFITDAIFGIILIPLLMLVLRLLRLSIPISIFLMSTYLASLAVLGTYATSIFALWGRNALLLVAPKDLYTLGILALLMIVSGFLVASYFVNRLTAPIVRLTAVSDRIAAGDYSAIGQLSGLTTRGDELGRLASAFQSMGHKVYEREHQLKAQVRELNIEINQAKQRKEVARITGTDYFRDLKLKVRTLRVAHEA